MARAKKRLSIWLLRLDVFTAGAVVLVLEIMGSRILAPAFGNSVYVWGSLIGVVLTSLSLGYYMGGELADKGTNFFTFSLIIFLAGLFILLIPFTSGYVFQGVIDLGMEDRYRPLIATATLLTIPTTLLGAVSPYAIKMATKSLAQLGTTAGNLYALSTVGSIAGVFLTVFVLIPEVGGVATIFTAGILLLAISSVGFSLRGKIGVTSLILLILYSTTLTYFSPAQDIIYVEDTPYHYLQVKDNPVTQTRTLILDDNPHSAMLLNNPNRSAFVYTKYFHLAFLFNPDIREVLFVGGGGFSSPKEFLNLYSNISVDVVEIDLEVVKVAKEFFYLVENPRLRVFNEDGRIFLSRTEKKYDLIILDAYSKTFIPFHLMTLEFFKLVEEHLNPGGLVASNLILSITGFTSDLLRAEYVTVAQVFPQLYLFPTRDDPSSVQNIILIASTSPRHLSREEILERARNSPGVGFDDSEVLAGDLFGGVLNMEGALLLTDDYAPVENLLDPVSNYLTLNRALPGLILAAIYLSSLIFLVRFFKSKPPPSRLDVENIGI